MNLPWNKHIVTGDTFYHIDRLGTLDIGDTIELNTSLELPTGDCVNLSPDDQEILSGEYPEGLSVHGIQYAPMRLGSIDSEMSTPTGSKVVDVMTATRIDGKMPNPLSASNCICEFAFELMRRAEFEDCLSRFQSVFAFETKADAIEWAEAECEESVSIYEVTGSDSSVAYDMEWLETTTFPKTLDQARRYWNGDRSDEPWLEVLLEPPVTVERLVETYESAQ